VPAFGESNGLILRSSGGTLAGLVGLDQGAVDKAEFASWFSIQVSKNFGPEASLHSSAPTMFDRISASTMRRKRPPSTSLPQEVKDGPEDVVRDRWRSSNILRFPRFP
jgi:hypothetical protein